jgi:hypothetical protein
MNRIVSPSGFGDARYLFAATSVTDFRLSRPFSNSPPTVWLPGLERHDSGENHDNDPEADNDP